MLLIEEALLLDRTLLVTDDATELATELTELDDGIVPVEELDALERTDDCALERLLEKLLEIAALVDEELDTGVLLKPPRMCSATNALHCASQSEGFDIGMVISIRVESIW